MSQSKKEKVVSPLNGTEIKVKITEIVHQLVLQEDSRETVNGLIKSLKEEYDLSSAVIRATAKIVHKRNKEETEDKNEQVNTLLSFCL